MYTSYQLLKAFNYYGRSILWHFTEANYKYYKYLSKHYISKNDSKCLKKASSNKKSKSLRVTKLVDKTIMSKNIYNLLYGGYNLNKDNSLSSLDLLFLPKTQQNKRGNLDIYRGLLEFPFEYIKIHHLTKDRSFEELFIMVVEISMQLLRTLAHVEEDEYEIFFDGSLDKIMIFRNYHICFYKRFWGKDWYRKWDNNDWIIRMFGLTDDVCWELDNFLYEDAIIKLEYLLAFCVLYFQAKGLKREFRGL
jgi:hypothetical protein